jgi:hypothetical protein
MFPPPLISLDGMNGSSGGITYVRMLQKPELSDADTLKIFQKAIIVQPHGMRTVAIIRQRKASSVLQDKLRRYA